MQPQYIRITIYDQTTKKARLLSISNNLKLSQLRELIEKQWELRQFKFINEGTLCSKATEKHTPVSMYMKAYNLISIISQLREEPKKQSKIIQKQSKRLAQSSMAQRHIANTREFLEKERINQEREKLYEERMGIFSNLTKGNVMGGQSDKRDVENIVNVIEFSNVNTCGQSQQPPLSTDNLTSAEHFKWTRENIEYCQLKYGVELSETGQGLGKQCHYQLIDLDNRAIKMEDFVRRDWRNVEWLAIYGCAVDDQAWKVIVANAHSFPQLKIIGLKRNQITTILEGDLEHFKSLKLVQFGTQEGYNPLTAESISVLKRFKQKNKHIRVKFRY